MAFILCNPGYGNGPILRCAEVAVALNTALEKAKKPRATIILPLLYGKRQRKMFEEEFPGYPFLFDETLGSIIASLLCENEPYEKFLSHWTDNVDSVSANVRTHIRSSYKNIICEIARVPLVETGISPAYAAGFAKISTILRASMKEDSVTITKNVLRTAAARMEALEKHYSLYLLTEPGSFPGRGASVIPPTLTKKRLAHDISQRSVYVTVSGMRQPELLSGIAQKLSVQTFSHAPEQIATARHATPAALEHENVVLHVARAGWGALWNSLITSTPLLTPPYDPDDDPEILFNIRRMLALKLGILYKGQPPAVLFKKAKLLKTAMTAYRKKLKARFGTLDGSAVAAQKILAHLLHSSDALR